MTRSTTTVVVVDDYKPWRRYVSEALQQWKEFQLIGEATDGLQAVQVFQQLKPDLILLDIGLPGLSGIEAARRIRAVSPKSRILFVTENRSLDFVEEALRTGARGYVLKSAAASELLIAMEAVLQGKRFVSSGLTGLTFGDAEDKHTAHHHSDNLVQLQQNTEIPHKHEAGFYSDDRSFLGDVTQFIVGALQVGNAAVVVANESHQDSLLQRLRFRGFNVDEAIEQGRYIVVHAADTLPMYMVDGVLDPLRYIEAFGNLIRKAERAAKGEHPRVAVYGEGVHLLWAQGNAEAAIQVETLCNQLSRLYAVDIFCGYFLGSIPGGMDTDLFQRIRAEHSVVYVVD